MDKDPIGSIIYFLIFIIIISLISGSCAGLLSLAFEGDFSSGFNSKAGWVLPVIIMVIFFAIMIFLFGGGKNNTNH